MKFEMSEPQLLLEDASRLSLCSPEEVVQKNVLNLYSHMTSVYCVTRRQQHLKENHLSQLTRLQARAIKILVGPVFSI